MSAKISIIIPVYNVERYLHRCIDSITNQTLKDIEIILIDDKSPDSCPQICDEYAQKDKRIKVIHKTTNDGLGIARNFGINIASGEYIAFCDSDDWVDPEFYETMYKQAKSENLDAVYSEFNTKYYPGFHVIPQNKKTYKNKNEIEDLMLDIIGPEPEYNSDVKFQASACKAIYKRSIITKYNIKFHSEREIISEDEIFNLDFLSKSLTVKYIPIQQYYYCLNQKSVTHIYRKDLWNKYQFFFHFLSLNYKQIFTKQDEFQIRINRSILFVIRRVIEQEIAKKTSSNDIYYQLCKICNEKNISQILKSYPLNRMPFKFFIFYNIIKYKKIAFLKIFFWIKNKRL